MNLCMLTSNILLASGVKPPPMNDTLQKQLEENKCQVKLVKEVVAKVATTMASKPALTARGKLE